jgi:hypothetical protein
MKWLVRDAVVTWVMQRKESYMTLHLEAKYVLSTCPKWARSGFRIKYRISIKL